MSEKQSKGIKGGKRPGAGRKPGVPNKRTAALQQAVEESGMTPLQFLLDAMRNEEGDPRERMAAAIAAAPYVHARLAAVELSGKVAVTKTDLDDAELAAIARSGSE